MKNLEVGEFDLHGHTRFSAFPEFVNYGPEEAILQAKKVGLNGIAITGHDTVKGLDKALNCAAREGVVLVPGIEITSRIGLRIPHILALGITSEEVYSNNYRIPTLKHPKTVIDWIHDHGGVAIAAHPTESGSRNALSHEEVDRFRDIIDGIEVITKKGVSQPMMHMAEERRLAQLGSSDFHMLGQIGLVATRIYGEVTNYKDVLDAIREQRTEAFIRTYIPEELQTRTPQILLRQWRGEQL